MVADLTKATITATLDGLATLKGTVDTNTFSGTMATVMAGDPHGLDSKGMFTGKFSGGFYGAQAAEAGGVFDFTSKELEAGAFRGAFGGDRKSLYDFDHLTVLTNTSGARSTNGSGAFSFARFPVSSTRLR